MRTTSLLACGLLAAVSTFGQTTNYARDLVNPFVGTGGHGHTFPGACVPNGLVQLSPDTRPDGYSDWDGCGGYHYSDSVIHGFSHTHLSGTGVADLCDVLLMPVAGEASIRTKENSSHFKHGNESAHAGYYRVQLARGGITAELTATARSGVHRYTFPAGAQANMVLDLLHRDKLTEASITEVGPNEITGSRRSSSWAGDQQLFFCIRFDRPMQGRLVMSDGTSSDQGSGVFAAGSTKARVAIARFGAIKQPLIVKVGISAVSIEGARANLDAEVPHWDFDQVRKLAEDAWNAKLSKIKVSGGTREQQRIFYTALYHCYVAPYIFNDVDGNYRGMDGQVHHADHNVYTVFSLWDTFRALHPLMTILEPDMTNDFIKTFLLHYQQGGKLPVWELWGNETNCMIGYHSVSVIADAYQKGIRGYDTELALKAMQASAMREEPGLNAYRRKGYISSEDESDDVSKTLEYAYNDACIFGMIAARTDRDLKDTYHRRGQSYEHLYDPTTGFFRARRNGGFLSGFDPFEVNFHYTEANAWQYSLFVPQNVPDLITMHGGDAGFEAHLDKLFSVSSSTSGREQADITGLIGQYAHGNEPSHHMAYLYNAINKPTKTRELVKRIMDEFYHDAPDGLIGNEDCGQMSAWYVMSAMGMYPVSPGIDTGYELGYPLFDRADVTLPNGKTWSMLVDAVGELKRDVPTDTSYYWSRIPHSVWHEDIVSGGRMIFNKDRGPARLYYRPPTVLDGAYIRSRARPGAPEIQAAAAAFADSLLVSVVGSGTCTYEDASGTHPCPTDSTFWIHNTSTVRLAWSEAHEPVTARFAKMTFASSITLGSTYANQYSAGGDKALVDGLRGGPDFRTGEWQGYQGQDVTATIDLGAVKKLKRAGLSVLQDPKSWIWYPSELVIAWSTNGRAWSSETINQTVDRKVDGSQTQEMWTGGLNKKARYVKIIAKNAGPCPDWHMGRGGTTWVFADEVLIEAE